MRNKSQRNQSEITQRKKRIIITKVYKYKKLFKVQIKLFIYYNERYITYRSINKKN